MCGLAEVEPVGLVMGGSVFYLGSPSLQASLRLSSRRLSREGRARGAELAGIGSAFDQARAKAIERLCSEARARGAHAVVDVRVEREHWASPGQCVEYILSGTAIRLPGRGPAYEPAVIPLPVDEYWQLVQAGYEPVGLAAASVVYETAPSAASLRALAGVRFSEGRSPREIPEFSAAVSGAIGIALARAGDGARKLGAKHMLGMRVERMLEVVDKDNTGRVPLSREPAKRKDLRVTVHLLGAAVRGSDATRERTARGTWRERDPAATAVKTTIALNATPEKPEIIARTEIAKGSEDARRDLS